MAEAQEVRAQHGRVVAAFDDAALQGMPDGKRRLIQAALELCAQGRSLSSLGVRQLGRRAGLNPNTFYRHFQDLEDLGGALAQLVARELMLKLREIREQAAGSQDVTVAVAKYFADHVLTRPEAFLVGLRELHGPSPRMRQILRDVLDDIATESVEQLTSLGLAGDLTDEALRQVTQAITWQLFHRASVLVDHPGQRETIVSELVGFIRTMFVGAAVGAATGDG